MGVWEYGSMGVWEYRNHKYGAQYARRESRRCHTTERDIRERSLGIVNTERDIHEGSRGAVRTIHAGGHGIVNVDMKRVKMLYVRSEICMKGVSDM